jgi:hypothetical protein
LHGTRVRSQTGQWAERREGVRATARYLTGEGAVDYVEGILPNKWATREGEALTYAFTGTFLAAREPPIFASISERSIHR